MRWCFISRCCAALVRFAAPFDMLTRGGGGGIASFMPKTKRYKRYTKNSSPREGVVNTVSYVKSNVSKLSVPAPVQYQIAPGRQVAYVLAPEDDFIRS